MKKINCPGVTNNAEDNIWYNDFNTSTRVNQKFVFDQTYILADSLMKFDWKLVPNETREIAGFVCRKAQTVIFDSVYVFAFYTDEITVSGGPMGIHGFAGNDPWYYDPKNVYKLDRYEITGERS